MQKWYKISTNNSINSNKFKGTTTHTLKDRTFATNLKDVRYRIIFVKYPAKPS